MAKRTRIRTLPTRWILPGLLGLAGFAVALGIMLWGGALVLSAQIGVADLLFVRAGGPRLGTRPVRQDIVLVLFDFDSAKKLGSVNSFTDDVTVYKNLLQAGANLVFDSRMVAVYESTAFEELRPLLDEMLVIDRDERLLRDVWLSSDLLTQSEGRYQRLLAQNVANMHPHTLPGLTSRLYPLACFVSAGPAESAPLVIARRALGLPRASATDVGKELHRSGIVSVWHEHSPTLVAKSDVPQSPYQMGKQEIHWHPFYSTTPLVPPAAFWVSYDPPATQYRRHSYVDVLAHADPLDFEGKYVILGYDAVLDPSADTYDVPSLKGKASAAELVACATQTLLDNRTITAMPKPLTITVMAVFIMALAFAAGLMRPVQAAGAATMLLAVYYALAVAAYRYGWFPDCLITPACGSLTAVAAGVGNAWLNLRLRRRVLDLFGRYVPRAVVNQLVQRTELEELTLGGAVRDVTVMFADIRGFTSFSENLPPETVVRELNALLEIMVGCTFENEGTLDKFIGDAILVLFNAPLDQADHTLRAVRTAVAIQERLAGHQSGLRVGVGVHRGEAVVGNIGTPQRMEYTAIGSTVNIASRLCDLAKPGDVVASQQVVDLLGEQFASEPLGAIEVKGIRMPLEVYRILPPKSRA